MDKFITPILLLICISILWYGIHYDKTHPPVCLTNTKVVSIDALIYRSAMITLADGQKVEVNQATLKPGDNFCTKWKKY